MIDFDIDLEFFSVGTERYEFIHLFQGYYCYNGNGSGSGDGYFWKHSRPYAIGDGSHD